MSSDGFPYADNVPGNFAYRQPDQKMAPAQGIEAEGRNTEGGSVHESPVDKVDAPPSLPPTGEGLPEEIVKAIEKLTQRARSEGYAMATGSGPQEAQAERNLNSAYLALDATILHHLSAARARAERAEKALRSLVFYANQLEALVYDPADIGEKDVMREARAALSSVAEPKGT